MQWIDPAVRAPPAEATDALAAIRAQSLVDQVADRIVAAIAAGQIVSGERLIETQLAAALAVSRVPVREALRILCSQGIVAATPRRGMRVAVFDADWAAQLHDVRVALERLGARQAARVLRAAPGERARLERIISEIGAAAGRNDKLAVNQADLAFHAALFRIADSPLLWTLWLGIARHVLVMFSIETYRDNDLGRLVADHSRYLDRLLHGSVPEIEAEIDRHVAGIRTFGAAGDGTPIIRNNEGDSA